MSKEHYTVPGMERLPFCTAVKAGDYIYLSGNAALKDDDGNDLTTVVGQTHQIMKNISNTLANFDATLDDLVKVTIFLGEQGEWTKMNDVYRSYFKGSLPARSTCIAGLVVPGFLLEIECVAYKP
jgi:enamine deaminase RidA (YjgF/YER057c/UK114 family)